MPTPHYLLDACALIALFDNEKGADVVSGLLDSAAYFKATGKMSFADTILTATARCTGATVVTCDHAELELVEQQTQIPFLWIRPRF